MDDRVKVSSTSGYGLRTLLWADVLAKAVFNPSYRRQKFFSNAEIACLAAPRPMLLVSDGDDWTKNNPTSNIRSHKKFMTCIVGKSSSSLRIFPMKDMTMVKSKRMAVYPFLSKHLGLDLKKISDKKRKHRRKFCDHR
jgi:hypothetical protein